jgi:opacity protein-like surface antigen
MMCRFPRFVATFASATCAATLLLAATLCNDAHAQEEDDFFDSAPPRFGFNYGETDTPRSGAMGGALRALGGANTAHYLNPANMGITRLYHIQALTQFTPEVGRHLYGGAIVDSTRRLSGGVSFIGGFQDADGIDRSHLDARISLAFAITNRFHLGLSGRYMNLDQEGVGPFGNSRASGGLVDPDDPAGRESLVNTVTFDAGMTIKATDELHIGVSGQNLSYPNNGILPTTVGGGIGYGTRDFSVEVDGVADFNSWPEISPRVMAGGEYLLANHFPIRVGYRFDLLAGSELDPSHQVSGGLGYVDTSFGVEASVRRTVAGPAATIILVGVSIHLESFGVPIQDY